MQYSELKLRSKIIDQLSEFLKPCYLQLKGHGLATAELITNYHQLMRHFQGIYCVSFDDEVHDNLDNEARYEYKHFKPESADEPIPAKRRLHNSTITLNKFKAPIDKGSIILSYLSIIFSEILGVVFLS